MAFRKAFWRWVTTRGADVPKEQCGQPLSPAVYQRGISFTKPSVLNRGTPFYSLHQMFWRGKAFQVNATCWDSSL